MESLLITTLALTGNVLIYVTLRSSMKRNAELTDKLVARNEAEYQRNKVNADPVPEVKYTKPLSYWDDAIPYDPNDEEAKQ